MGDDRRGGAGGQGSRARTEDVVAAMEEGAEGGNNQGSSIHNENRALQEPPRWKFNVNVKNQLSLLTSKKLGQSCDERRDPRGRPRREKKAAARVSACVASPREKLDG